MAHDKHREHPETAITLTTDTMPHPALPALGTTPPASRTAARTIGAGLRPEAREALADAVAATDLVRDAREEMQAHADRRRAAILAASRAGVPQRRIALELGVSPGNISALVDSARQREAAARR